MLILFRLIPVLDWEREVFYREIPVYLDRVSQIYQERMNLIRFRKIHLSPAAVKKMKSEGVIYK
jgi:hypothetical protein